MRRRRDVTRPGPGAHGESVLLSDFAGERAPGSGATHDGRSEYAGDAGDSERDDPIDDRSDDDVAQAMLFSGGAGFGAETPDLEDAAARSGAGDPVGPDRASLAGEHQLAALATRRRSRQDAARRQNLPLRLVLGGGIVFVVSLLATAGGKGYRDLQIIKQREVEVSARIATAEQRLEDLRHRIQLLREDPATLERLAREELGLVGPEDIVFVLPDAPADPAER